ncbi:MAG TPA: hypothetical protein VEX68_16120 [Bryobacteraceae bacterium]|nr:hypothetical protein [Bryobacteraceae bacterium]
MRVTFERRQTHEFPQRGRNHRRIGEDASTRSEAVFAALHLVRMLYEYAPFPEIPEMWKIMK